MLQGLVFEPQMESEVMKDADDYGTGVAACHPDLRYTVFKAFDTECSFFADVEDDSLFQAIKERCVEYDNIFSHTNPRSSLTFLNSAFGMPAEVNHELAVLIGASLEYCAKTGGLLDITAGTLERLWNYHRASKPSQEQIDEALKHVGYQMVHVHGDVVCVDDPDARIVLGSTAKGYIADGLCDLMREHGVTSGLVDLGGNLACVGAMPGGNPWRFNVIDPLEQGKPKGERKPAAVIECNDESAVTSGVYERKFASNGKAYHHIIDPRAGYPATSDILGVTVVAESSFQSDALSTSLLLLGSRAGMDLAREYSDVGVLMVLSSGEVVANQEMRNRIVYASR